MRISEVNLDVGQGLKEIEEGEREMEETERFGYMASGISARLKKDQLILFPVCMSYSHRRIVPMDRCCKVGCEFFQPRSNAERLFVGCNATKAPSQRGALR